MDSGTSDPNLYQILQVHPTAPLDLITAAYWRLTGRAQALQGVDHAAQLALYHLTKAYQTLVDASARAAYDLSLGLELRRAAKPPRKRNIATLFAGRRPARSDEQVHVDYYELLRVDPLADASVVSEGHVVMRNQYLRLARRDRAYEELLDHLEEAYDTLSDPLRRRNYDEARAKNRSERTPTAAATTPLEAQVEKARAEVKKPAVRDEKLTGEPAAKEDPEPVAATASAHSRRRNPQNRSLPVPVKHAGRPRVSIASIAPEIAAEAAGNVPSTGIPIHNNGEFSTPREVSESRAIKLAQALAVKSALLVVSGAKGSLALARSASHRLKQALDAGDRDAKGEDVVEEEEALLYRLASSPLPCPPSPTEEPALGRRGVLARLTLVEGPGNGTVFEVNSVPFTLGGDGGCDVRLPGLASQQARLLYNSGQFVLYSLTESPETRIHGDSVDWAVLESGDALEVGPYKLRFDSLSA